MPPQPLEGFTTAGPSPGVHQNHQPHHLSQQQQQLQHQQQLKMMSALQPAPEAGPRPGYIPLTMLIDFIIQRTYHDLTVLAELLPRKTDMERKIEIYNFTARTKQLFIRLLALVKWAGSSSKVEKSCDIMTFLDKQSMLFVDTADALSRMSREMLFNARLPNFQIPEAIEVLTTGTYSRLPTCIKERIVPLEPLVGPERNQTLRRLNQIIQHRLVTGNTLPQQMRNFKIENGRVQFRVEQEFEVGLTLMGDAPDIPWRMLEIEILVEDTETGSSGTSLVHCMQLGFIHELVQARLTDSPNPVQEVYNCLHFFCQSLQLEVLFGQTMHLKQHRLNDSVQVEEYVRGSKLTVSYWRDLSGKPADAHHRSELGYRLTVQTDPNDSDRPLAVFHLPSIGNKESAEMADRAVRTDRLSMERLLVHTVYIRSLARLTDMRAEFQTFHKDVEYQMRGTPAVLTVPILLPSHDAEHLHISVDTHTGQLRCHVPKHLACPLTTDLQAAMNGDHAKLPALVRELRFWLARRRCEYSLQKLPVVAHEHIPLLLDGAGVVDVQPEYAAIVHSGRNKVFVRYNQHPGVIVVIEMSENAERVGEMHYAFHLAFVKAVPVTPDTPNATKPSSAAELTSAPSTSPSTSSTKITTSTAYAVSDTAVEEVESLASSTTTSLPKTFLRVELMTQFDTFAATHGPSTSLFDPPPSKRVRFASTTATDTATSITEPPLEFHSSVAYMVPDLAHTVAMFADKLPFLALANELGSRGIPHSGVQTDIDASVVCVRVLAMPPPPTMEVSPTAAPTAAHVACVSPLQWAAMQQRLLAVNVRQLLSKNLHTRSWSVELVFAGSPVAVVSGGSTTTTRQRGDRRSLLHQYDLLSSKEIGVTVDALLRDWSCVVYLFGLVYDFGQELRNEMYQHRLSTLCTIRSYTYTELLLGYGPEHESLVTVRWCAERRAFRLCFGRLNASEANPHAAIGVELEAHLNRYFSLAQLVHLLHETYRPLSAVAQLDVIPHYGIPRPTVPVLSFCLLPQTPTMLRLAYQAMYCLELRIHGGGMLSIRDAAHSRFAKQPPMLTVDEFAPTQGLLSFLRKYAIDASAAPPSVYLRRMQGEEDNPLSPANATATAAATTALAADSPIAADAQSTALSGAAASTLLPPLSISLSFANGTLLKTGGSGAGPQSPIAAATTAGLRFPASVTPPPTPASPLAGNHITTSPASHHQQQQPHSVGNATTIISNSTSSTNSNNIASANGSVQSPLSIQRPASAPIHSPQSATAIGSDQSSPFNAPSPAAAAAAARASPRPPGSVAIQAGTEQSATTTTNNRLWAGAVPTMLTTEALEELLRPGVHPEPDILGPAMCPLERFLGCVNIRRNLQRYIQSEDFLTPIECATPGVVVFRVDTLEFHVSLSGLHMQSLHLQVRQVDASNLPTGTAAPPVHQWSALDLVTLERYFDLRVVSPPYRPNTLFGFCRMLNVPPLVLRDLLHIIRVEMQPAAAAEAMPGLRWHVQLLMRVPPSAPKIVPTGNAAVHMIRQKILFFLQITRIPANDYIVSSSSASPPTSPPLEDDTAAATAEPHSERPSLVIPMVYDVNANITQLAERRDDTGTITSSATNSASQLLRRFAELHKANAATSGECTIFPAIRELLTNYVMPIASPIGGGETQQQQQQQQTTTVSGPVSVSAERSLQLQQQLVPSQSIVIVGGGTTTTTNNNNSTSTVKVTVDAPPQTPTPAIISGNNSSGGGATTQQQQQPQTVAYMVTN